MGGEAEIAILTDRFTTVRTRQGVYSSSQMDTGWTKEIKNDFYGWLDENKRELCGPTDRIEEVIKERLIDSESNPGKRDACLDMFIQ